MRSLILASLLLLGCTDESAAIHTIQSAGFTSIRTTGYEPFGCGEGDVSSTGFVATNVRGERVSGVVCCGITKGCTVRF